MIIALVGEKLAGKDTVAEHLVKQYGAEHFRTSKILDELLEVLGLPLTRQNEISAGMGMERMFGPEIIGQALQRRLQKSTAHMVLINGLRQEYQFLNAKKMGAIIIYVTAPADLRYKRSLGRSNERKDGDETYEEFVAQDSQWTEVDIPAFGARADFVVQNTGSLENLYEKIDSIVQQLMP